MTGGSGTVVVTTTGDVTVQVSGAKASTTFDGFFCQYPSSYLYHSGREGCFALNQSLVSDASGNAKLSFHFPKSGSWAGAFFFDPNGNTSYSPDQITTNVTDTDGTVSAPLLPAGKVNPPNTGNPYIPSSSPQEPGSGSVTVGGGNVKISLTGARANTSYGVGACFSDGGSACQQIGKPFTTDASGNATVTLPAAAGTGTIISVGASAGDGEFGLITGFTVP